MAESRGKAVHPAIGPVSMAIERTSTMPTELVFLGGILAVAAGLLIFVLIHRQHPAEPPHFR
jgi:hypothetical protein